MSRALKAVNPAVIIEIDPAADADGMPVAAWARNIANIWRTTTATTGSTESSSKNSTKTSSKSSSKGSSTKTSSKSSSKSSSKGGSNPIADF
jgi:hypothetical protein